MSILFVNGLNDQCRNRVLGMHGDGQLLFDPGGTLDIRSAAGLTGASTHDIMLLGDRLKQPAVKFPQDVRLIVNQIADAETHQGALRRCKRICDEMRRPVINHPDRVSLTRRDEVSGMLQDIPGVAMPRTVRCSPSRPGDIFDAAAAGSIGLPFVMSEAAGTGVPQLVEAETDESALHRHPFDGRDYFLTTFQDYRAHDRLYHRYRVAVINSRPIMVAALFDRDWRVSWKSLDYMQTRPEIGAHGQRVRELQGAVIPELEERIATIARRLGLQVFGLDFHLAVDGTMMVFEAGAQVSVLPGRDADQRLQAREIRKHLLVTMSGFVGERIS